MKKRLLDVIVQKLLFLWTLKFSGNYQVLKVDGKLGGHSALPPLSFQTFKTKKGRYQFEFMTIGTLLSPVYCCREPY